MLFTNVAILLLVLYFCVAQQLNDKEAVSAESSKESGRRFHPNGKIAGRRWVISRNGPYKRVVSSAEHDVPDTKEEENNTTESTEESEQSKEKSKKTKLLTSRTHQQNVTDSDGVRPNNTRHYVEVGRSRGHKDYSGTARRRPISTESDVEYSTQSSNKRRRMPTIPTTTNVPQTMSYSLYNYFRPLEQDVPQDDILPFLDFGRKLSPAVPTPSGFNSIENKSTVGRLRIHVTEPSVTPTDDETVHEEMDLGFDRRVIERNSVPRGRLHASPIISNLYRKPNTQTTRTSDNLVITSDCIPSTHNGQKKHSRTQEQQIESRKNRSICASTESDTVVKKTDGVEKQTMRKMNDVEIISDIKSPYKSSELKQDDSKSRSAIAAEPSNVKAIFKDVQGSDLFNSDPKMKFTVNDTTDTSITAQNSTVNAPKAKEPLREVETSTQENVQASVIPSTSLVGNDKVENMTEAVMYDGVQVSALPLKNIAVHNKTKESKENSHEMSNAQEKNHLKAVPPSNISLNNTNITISQNSNRTRDRPFQIKPNFRSHFRHPAFSKKALRAPLSQLRVSNTTQSNDTLNDVTKPETQELSKQNMTDPDSDENRNIPLKEVETPSPVVTTTTPDSQKSKILSTAVVTSISVHESSNSSVPVTETPLVNRSNSKLNVAEPLPLLLQENVKQSNTTMAEVVQASSKTLNVEDKLTHEDLTTGREITTTLPPPVTTTDVFVNYTSTKASVVDSVTNFTLINETTTDNVATTTVETTSFIPTDHYILPNVTFNHTSDVTIVENPVLTVNDTKRPKSTITPETTVVPNSEIPETINTEETVIYDPTIAPAITVPPEEVTLPTEEDLSSVLPTAESNSTFIPSDKDSVTDLETAVVKEEQNNISIASNNGDLGNKREQNSLAVPDNSSHKDVEIAYQEGIGITTYILVFLGVVPIVLGAMVAGRFLVLHSRKKVLDESEYSSEYNRSPLAIGAASPLPTKLPRVPTHLGWEVEKSTPTILPTTSARWEFPREKLRLQTLLGQGNFGQVWKAEADDISGHEGLTRLVAVKTVKESANTREREDLLRELGIMQDLGSHPNVVTLLGCCTEKEPYFLIMEYVMYGKLLAFLRDHRTRAHYYNFSDVTDALTSRDLTVFAYCVARGMDYLSNKGIIHRDLAARNILVDHNKLCKIADFGMSRNVRDTGQIYEQRQSKGALPIRWMAPESLHFSLFTQKSDVWSFGILMWEIVTLGSTPYATMGAREVMRRVRDGYRLERPSHCRIEFFRVISRCWHSDPNKRPTFSELKQEIGQLLGDSENGGGYVDLESLADEIKQGMHNSSSLQRKH